MNEKYQKILENVSKVIVGKEKVVTMTLAALVAGGHVLLEDVPGTGKTMLAKALARSINADFARIQFTPDLLPSDVTGLNVWRVNTGEFSFTEGPVFTNILLADEINRATPRTQAGLLECMEERQVTIDGVTRMLEEPFFVIATQNPLETGGTFPLPEAQMDRFIMRLSMGLPDKDEELRILRRFENENPLDMINPVADVNDILRMREDLNRIQVSDIMAQYITDITQATRKRNDVSSPVSPRGSLALMKCARAMAMFDGRDYVVPEDIKALAIPVLAHRLLIPHRFGDPGQQERIIGEILSVTQVPTEDFK